MATVSQFVTPCKPVRAYYAHLFEEPGVLTKLDGTIYFMAADKGIITEIDPDHCNFLTVLGEIGLADTQHLMDQLAGGAAQIACTRI